jgi:hypothetical protein
MGPKVPDSLPPSRPILLEKVGPLDAVGPGCRTRSLSKRRDRPYGWQGVGEGVGEGVRGQLKEERAKKR